jgi:hypothetical protein
LEFLHSLVHLFIFIDYLLGSQIVPTEHRWTQVFGQLRLNNEGASRFAD